MRSLFTAAIVLIAASYLAQADTFYTDPAAWNAAASGVTTINFEGIADPNGFQAYPGTTTVGGVTFATGPSSPGSALFIIGDNFYGFGVATVSSQGPGTGIPNNDLLITLPGPVTALALNYIVDPGTLTFTLSDSAQTTATPGATPTSGFLGVTAPGGITSIDIVEPYSLAAASVNVSDFSYATAATVPEPSTVFLLGGALIILASLSGIDDRHLSSVKAGRRPARP